MGISSCVGGAPGWGAYQLAPASTSQVLELLLQPGIVLLQALTRLLKLPAQLHMLPRLPAHY